MQSYQVFFVTVWLTYAGQCAAQAMTPSPSTASERLAKQASIYLTYAQDFFEMAKARHDNPNEQDIAWHLYTSASSANDYLDAASALLWVYEQITSAQDWQVIRPFLLRLLAHYANQLDISAKATTNDLSFTGSAGIAATAVRFCDQLRETETLLRGLKIP